MRGGKLATRAAALKHFTALDVSGAEFGACRQRSRKVRGWKARGGRCVLQTAHELVETVHDGGQGVALQAAGAHDNCVQAAARAAARAPGVSHPVGRCRGPCAAVQVKQYAWRYSIEVGEREGWDIARKHRGAAGIMGALSVGSSGCCFPRFNGLFVDVPPNLRSELELERPRQLFD